MAKRLSGAADVMRFMVLIALIGTMTAIMPGRASAAIEEEGYYESPRFGFTVEYDETAWIAQAIDDEEESEGVRLDNELTWATVRGTAWEDIDEEACLVHMSDSFDEDETMREFRRAPRSTELPESELGGEAAIYTMVMGEDEPVELYMYLHCVSIADGEAAMMIFLSTPVSAYENALPDWNGLLAGIDPGEGPVERGGAPDDDRDNDEAAGGSYVNEEIGFALTWDVEIWAVAEFEDETGFGVEFETELSFGYVTTAVNDDARTPEECVELIATNLEEGEMFKRVRKAPSDMERIETAPNAHAELYTMIVNDSVVKYAVHLECRELPNPDEILVVYISAEVSDFEDERGSWQELINGLEILDESESDSRDAGEDDGSDSRDTREEDEPVDDAGTFVGENHDIAFTYDEDLWTADVSTEEGFDWVGLSSDYGQVILLATSTDVDLDGCQETLLEDEQQYAEGDIDRAPRSYDRPETARDAEGELYIYDASTEDGAVETLVYFDCRYIEEGESILAVTVVTYPDVYEDALPEIEAILESIEIG